MENNTLNSAAESVLNNSCLVRVRISFERGNAALDLSDMGIVLDGEMKNFSDQFLTGGILRLCPVEKVNTLQSIAVTMRSVPLKFGFRSNEFRGIVVKGQNVSACVEKLNECKARAENICESILSAYDIDHDKIVERCWTQARLAYCKIIGENMLTLYAWQENQYVNEHISKIANDLIRRIPTRAAIAARFSFGYSITRLALSQSVVSQAEYESALAKIADLEDTPENREEKQRLEILRQVHEASAESARVEYEAQVSELITRSVATVRETVMAMTVELASAVAKEGKVTKRHAAKLEAMRDAARMLAWDGDTFTSWVETQTTGGENMTPAELGLMLASMRATIETDLSGQVEERVMRVEDSCELIDAGESEPIMAAARVVRALESEEIDYEEIEVVEESRILRG